MLRCRQTSLLNCVKEVITDSGASTSKAICSTSSHGLSHLAAFQLVVIAPPPSSSVACKEARKLHAARTAHVVAFFPRNYTLGALAQH